MNAYPISWRNSLARVVQHALALLSIWTLLCGTLAAPINAQQEKAAPRSLSEEQRILHVLNRLGFGARPGDVERVRAMGIEQYIKQQLDPERIPDALAEAKVRDLPSLRMSTAELYAKYPQPGMLLRQMQRRGEMPAELAGLLEKRGKGVADTAKAGAAPVASEDEAMNAQTKEQASATDSDRREYRQAIRDYYIKNNLLPPQRLVAELQASRILRAVYSERQLQEVMVDFWTNHFNVFAGKGADKWLLVAYDRDTIRPNALGKFRDLLQATAESPAMLFYLDNFQSVSPNAQAGRPALGQPPFMRRRPFADLLMRESVSKRSKQAANKKRPKRGINENYARELMELHTLGVDGGYTQKDVQEVARCFTGWTISNPRGRMGDSEDAGKFYFNARLHDDGEKIVLGHRIPAGGGMKDGLMVLDILARHPSTAKFIATKLARRFVMDNPSPQLVDRIAAAFTSSDGSIRETLRAVFSSPEFNSPAAYRAKIKTPFELAVSAVRTLGGETNGGPGLHQWIAKMGEGLYQYQAPTGYPDTAEDWVNAGSLLERLNFGLALAGNRIPGTRVNLQRFLAGDTSTDGARIMDRFLNLIVQGDVSAGTKRTLMKQLSEPTATNALTNKEADTQATSARTLERRTARIEATGSRDSEVVKAVGLILGSPEFQRQ